MTIIDITKKYTTRSGLPVRIYATDAGGIFSVHGAVGDWTASGHWSLVSWLPSGKRCNATPPDDWDLLPVKTWRAWEEGEAPKFFMSRDTRYNTLVAFSAAEVAAQGPDGREALFRDWARVYEDGTETPCGVEE